MVERKTKPSWKSYKKNNNTAKQAQLQPCHVHRLRDAFHFLHSADPCRWPQRPWPCGTFLEAVPTIRNCRWFEIFTLRCLVPIHLRRWSWWSDGWSRWRRRRIVEYRCCITLHSRTVLRPRLAGGRGERGGVRRYIAATHCGCGVDRRGGSGTEGGGGVGRCRGAACGHGIWQQEESVFRSKSCVSCKGISFLCSIKVWRHNTTACCFQKSSSSWMKSS